MGQPPGPSALKPLARQAFALFSKQRSRVSRWLSLASEMEIAETLSQVSASLHDATAFHSQGNRGRRSGPSRGRRDHAGGRRCGFNLDEPS